jgi:hypothetical protein
LTDATGAFALTDTMGAPSGTYRLLADHWLPEGYGVAGATYIPTNPAWKPTPFVDPLDTAAVAATVSVTDSMFCACFSGSAQNNSRSLVVARQHFGFCTPKRGTARWLPCALCCNAQLRLEMQFSGDSARPDRCPNSN